ncbi:helix-turn-helix domain-containing protein [Vibrio cholerae]|uniref:helix-turn-helix domain-containing protein n=1 Tax=Vibrio cholerae TaxID=666 RepID=UPI000BA91DEB|nr:helix-turn-helix domain-containing protein [Vibrio cholerae]PAR92351.1 hypothetical protein CGT82_17180 [Vibrio cholerae]
MNKSKAINTANESCKNNPTDLCFTEDLLNVNNGVIKEYNYNYISNSYISYTVGVSGIFSSNVKSKSIFLLRNFDELRVKKKSIAFNNTSIVLVKGDFSVKLKPESQIICIDNEFYRYIGIPNLYAILDSHCYIEGHANERLITSLLDSICCSTNPLYELLAIGNIIGTGNYKSNLDSIFNLLKSLIEENAINEDFNLDMLSTLAFMSRRKIQYIFLHNKTSFSKLVADTRLSKLKQLLLTYPEDSISQLVYMAGFNSYNSAARLFKSRYNLNISDFRNKYY